MNLRHIDPRTTPISRRGSWMSVARLTDEAPGPRGAGIYLRSNRSRPYVTREVFRIVPLSIDADDVCIEGVPAEVVVRDRHGEPVLTVLFSGRSTVRIVARVPVVLESAFAGTAQRKNAAHAVAYREPSGRFVVNAKAWLRRYAVEIEFGGGTLDAPWDGEMISHADIRLNPDSTGLLDVAIDEFWSTWIPSAREEPSAIRDGIRRELEDFVGAFPPVAPERSPTATEAQHLLWMCTQSPAGLIRREATLMSLNWMDSVWSWDNWINLTTLAPAHPDLAFGQHLAIADHQDDFGAYPDALTDGFIHFNFSKPPVQGILASLVDRVAPGFWTPERKRNAYDSIRRFTGWWLLHRRAAGDDLCHYLHGNDSGWDNGTLLLSGVPVIMPDLNAFLVAQCRLLARWGIDLGDDPAEIARWQAEGDRLRDALVRDLWRGGTFVALRLPDRTAVDSQSLAAALPAVIADELPGDVRAGLLARLTECETRWGLASEAPSSRFYEADNYWRGPIWAPTTLLGVLGLERLGAFDAAARVRQGFLDLVERSGFAECFHAETGAPLVDPGYTWTASVYLLLSYEVFAHEALSREGVASRVPADASFADGPLSPGA